MQENNIKTINLCRIAKNYNSRLFVSEANLEFSISVERRRRYNINDRIKELGTLLPKEEDQ